MRRIPTTTLAAMLAIRVAVGASDDGKPVAGTASPAASGVFFDNVAPEAGVGGKSFGRAAAMADFDGDGLLDLLESNTGMPNFFYRQKPDRTFEEASEAWGVEPRDDSTYGNLVADFDNDGDPDVYFLNGGFSSPQLNQFLRNDIATAGVFADVTAEYREGEVPSHSFGASALDYDRDGDLDIFHTNSNFPGATCTLLRNEGDLFFTDVSEQAGFVQLEPFIYCSAGDVDNDMWPDVAAGAFFQGSNRLYRNRGDGTFEEFAMSAGVSTSRPDNFGLHFDDFDNDGWMDLYNPKHQISTPDGPSRIFRNMGDGTFADATPASVRGQSDMGHSSHDVDADGYPDIYIGTGFPERADPDVLLLMGPDGAGGLRAIDHTAESGLLALGPTRCHGMAFGDYDDDGDIDVWVNNGGIEQYPGTDEPNALWRSRGNANGWIKIDLTGVFSNRDGIGARLTARTTAGRDVRRHRASGRGFSNSDAPTVFFGLGSDPGVERVEIAWPSGIRQRIAGPPLRSRTRVRETGIRARANPAADSVEIDVAGPPGGAAILLADDFAPPTTPRLIRGLDSAGKATIVLPRETLPFAASDEYHFLAWIYPRGGGGFGSFSEVESVARAPFNSAGEAEAYE